MNKCTFSVDCLNDIDKVDLSANVTYIFDADEVNIDTMLYHFTQFLKAMGYTPGELVNLNTELEEL